MTFQNIQIFVTDFYDYTIQKCLITIKFKNASLTWIYSACIGGTEIKEEADNCSTTRSQKGDECATDDSSFPPRKRKLRNKTEQQTLQVSAATTTAPKSNQPLEKPPNPYETYLNLRRRVCISLSLVLSSNAISHLFNITNVHLKSFIDCISSSNIV